MAQIITGNYRLLKDLNSNVVLNLVRTKAPISGADLAKITGMRPSTIHNILKNLEREGFILKTGTGDSTKLGGRRPTLWEIKGRYGYVIGIQIEINEVEVVLVDINSQIIDDRHIIIKEFNTLSDIENTIIEITDEMLKNNSIKKERLLGIGIGVSGLVDITNGAIIGTSLLPTSNQPINLQTTIEDYFGAPVYVENDANAAVLAEKWFANYNGNNNMVYTLIVVGRSSFGIGFGLMLNGEIYRGSNMFAGETELFSLNIKKLLTENCHYKSEDFTVGDQVVALDDLQLHHLIKALDLKSKCAITFFEEVGKIVGNELIRALNMLDPKLIVIGGEILAAGNFIIDPIKQVVQKRFPLGGNRKYEIVGSSLSNYSVALGAATIILKLIYHDPLTSNDRLKKQFN